MGYDLGKIYVSALNFYWEINSFWNVLKGS